MEGSSNDSPHIMKPVDKIPDSLPILPLRETVVFPETVTPLAVGQERSVKLIDDVLHKDKMIGLATIRNPDVETAGPDDIFEIGTAAIIHKMLKVPDGSLRILVQGVKRIKVVKYTKFDPYLTAKVKPLEDKVEMTKEVEALSRNLQNVFTKIIGLVPYLPEELQMAASNVDDPSALCYLIASAIKIRTEEKQDLLEEIDVEKRLRKLTVILNRELEVFELGSKIQNDVQSEMDKNQREYFLRQQMKAIQEELGETDEIAAEVNELRAQIDELKLPEEVDRQARRELDRLSKMQPAAAEYSVIRTYLDWLITIPWNKGTEDILDIARAQQVLDEDHYDLEKVKNRILEYLSVAKLKKDMAGPILCFVGPPGVGKTSLGHSIARALGRKFIRISVGGVRDEAEIRGHRRTYIGAMPGTIIRAIRDAESNNPVFAIDEMDKLGADFRGDPSSALLEVLDPEQHFSYRDHYLDLPFDLSRVLFIATANMLDPIPPALRDRMEVIELSGYTEEEKLHIAKKYLVSKQTEANGLTTKNIGFNDKAILRIIQDYTREAGLRNLEREIGSVCRKVAREIAEGKKGKFKIDEKAVGKYLGKKRYFSEAKRMTSEPGVATGLAWTTSGGDIIFIEATSMHGSGTLTLTGQLGDVMKESAQAALSWVRTHSDELGIPEDYFQKHDIHVHVPAGAVPKDGPSAGVTMTTALASLAIGKSVAANVGMTGEVTLSGKVLPIGGLKEKVLAARRAGLDTIILPSENEKDLDDVPEHLRKTMKFIPVDEVHEVLAAALLDGSVKAKAKASASGRKKPATAGKSVGARKAKGNVKAIGKAPGKGAAKASGKKTARKATGRGAGKVSTLRKAASPVKASGRKKAAPKK
ncbi:MAG: endopeptidase La [Thermoleophilia bacterium]|nr:endopeptidase La [Thermoleophilia bacterium]